VLRFLSQRLLQGVVTLWVLLTVVFVMFRLLPGDPALTLLDPTFPPEVRQLVRAQFGLDRPLPVQYVHYLANVARGNLGQSFFYKAPVAEVLGYKLGNTLILALTAFVVAYTIGILAGVLLAWKRGTRLELVGILVALVLRSAPLFWTGMVALMIFSFWLNWLPHAGMRTPGYEAATFVQKFFTIDFLRHLILPTTVAVLHFMALPMLLMRNTMLEVLGEDFVELARAKGLRERTVMYRHVARNAVLPIVTAAAVYIGLSAGGQTLIEYVFSWPGLGREIVFATQRHDYPVAQGAFLMLGVMVIIMNIIADLLYAYLDPRIAYR
jgi:peptide/nickel transport system permease protein